MHLDVEETCSEQQPATLRSPAHAWLSTPAPGTWTDSAACHGMYDLADSTSSDVLDLAQQVCARCAVAEECGRYGIEARAFGVWGGQLLRAGRPVGVARACPSPDDQDVSGPQPVSATGR
jgi:hypothetical protein